jgi:hypothetical protein
MGIGDMVFRSAVIPKTSTIELALPGRADQVKDFEVRDVREIYT